MTLKKTYTIPIEQELSEWIEAKCKERELTYTALFREALVRFKEKGDKRDGI